MVNINDVAHRAHVSKMTVSRVINHPEKVSDEVRKVVEKAIKDLNYKPNRAGRSLVTNRNYVIQFLILEELETVEPNYAVLLLHLSYELQKYGYSLEIAHKITKDRPVDAIIVTGWRKNDLTDLAKLSVPVVLYGQCLDNFDLPYVDVDNYLGTKKATEYLIKNNYQSIYYVGYDLEMPFSTERERGYLDAMQKESLPTNILKLNNHSRDSEKVIAEMLDDISENSAFVCSTDRLAMGVLRAVNKKFAIPKQISVIGFDGVFIDKITNPRLSTVRQPFEKIVEKLVLTVIQKIKNEANTNYLIEPDLVIRESSK